MTEPAMFWTILIGLTVIGFGVIVVMVIRDVREPRADLPLELAHTPHPATARMYQPGRHLIWTHTAPPRPFTVEQAHQVMRQHLECAPAQCGRKREARRTLTEAGVMKPRTRQRVRAGS
ncbi:hypothetical protein [Nocardia miyunensis]|uniref:hypothetical protein n=1 Tax=Nocardia miyunensis TaxID=282684 RepID=UPI00082CB66E|nr:hypothetical protein [Nocardia miyunensis]